MAKVKISFICQKCGANFSKWGGQCFECKSWNSIVESVKSSNSSYLKNQNWTGNVSQVTTLDQVDVVDIFRFSTLSNEFDRVLGGGLVPGSVILVGGDPGIGKSTMLLQSLCYLSNDIPALYVSGEESQQQIAMRAQRLNLPLDKLKILIETNIEKIISISHIEKPKIIVIDSIQTIFTEIIASAAGSVSQVRESTSLLVKFAKQTQTCIFLVGHVTKEGSIAGPRILEHMVDTVLYFEGQNDNRFRMLRAIKNRFGAVNELGIFAMTDKGLKEISNPSAIFLTKNNINSSGSVITAIWEGTRPILIEVQALVDESHSPAPRRVTQGLDSSRLIMLLAVLHKSSLVATYGEDVFINVVGGVKISETACDLVILAVVFSSLRNIVLPSDLLIFGEVGLSGEIRPVPGGLERVKEASKHGFKKALVPADNKIKNKINEMEIISINHINQAIEFLKNL